MYRLCLSVLCRSTIIISYTLPLEYVISGLHTYIWAVFPLLEPHSSFSAFPFIMHLARLLDNFGTKTSALLDLCLVSRVCMHRGA